MGTVSATGIQTKSMIILLLVSSCIFHLCLSEPRHFLIETEDEGDELERYEKEEEEIDPDVLEDHELDELAVKLNQELDDLEHGTDYEDYQGAEGFEKAVLDRHNAFRRAHGVPALTLDPKLTESAKKWATNLAQKNLFLHSIRGKTRPSDVNENIYATFVSDSYIPAGRDLIAKRSSANWVVDDWYNEFHAHKYGKDDFSSCTGHFTQAMWKGTKRIGCAKVEKFPYKGKRGTYKKGKRVVVACHYSPPGNVVGKFNENVLAPRGPVRVPSWDKCHLGENVRCKKPVAACRSRQGKQLSFSPALNIEEGSSVGDSQSA